MRPIRNPDVAYDELTRAITTLQLAAGEIRQAVAFAAAAEKAGFPGGRPGPGSGISDPTPHAALSVDPAERALRDLTRSLRVDLPTVAARIRSRVAEWTPPSADDQPSPDRKPTSAACIHCGIGPAPGDWLRAGLCGKHYKRWTRAGRPTPGTQPFAEALGEE